MHPHCGTNNSVHRLSFMGIWTLELRPGVREESASPTWQAALVIFRTLKSCYYNYS